MHSEALPTISQYKVAMGGTPPPIQFPPYFSSALPRKRLRAIILTAMGLLEALIISACSVGSLCIYAVWKFIIRPMYSPINKLPGPRADSFIYGQAFEAHIGDSCALWKKWEAQYGTAILGIGPLGVSPPKLASYPTTLISNDIDKICGPDGSEGSQGYPHASYGLREAVPG